MATTKFSGTSFKTFFFFFFFFLGADLESSELWIVFPVNWAGKPWEVYGGQQLAH